MSVFRNGSQSLFRTVGQYLVSQDRWWFPEPFCAPSVRLRVHRTSVEEGRFSGGRVGGGVGPWWEVSISTNTTSLGHHHPLAPTIPTNLSFVYTNNRDEKYDNSLRSDEDTWTPLSDCRTLQSVSGLMKGERKGRAWTPDGKNFLSAHPKETVFIRTECRKPKPVTFTETKGTSVWDYSDVRWSRRGKSCSLCLRLVTTL